MYETKFRGWKIGFRMKNCGSLDVISCIVTICYVNFNEYKSAF